MNATDVSGLLPPLKRQLFARIDVSPCGPHAGRTAYTTGVSITVDGGLTLMSAIANQQYAERYSSEPNPRSAQLA